MKANVMIGGVLAAAVLAVVPVVSWGADDGAKLYKSKCAGCHGAAGGGKPAMKAPALKGTAKTTDQLAAHILKGEADSKPPHNKGVSGVNEAQAKAIADFVKTLK